MLRTHNCGELNINHEKKEVTLSGWVNKTRLHGSLIFVDVKDRYGMTQLVFDESNNKEVYESAKKLRRDSVV